MLIVVGVIAAVLVISAGVFFGLKTAKEDHSDNAEDHSFDPHSVWSEPNYAALGDNFSYPDLEGSIQGLRLRNLECGQAELKQDPTLPAPSDLADCDQIRHQMIHSIARYAEDNPDASNLPDELPVFTIQARNYDDPVPMSCRRFEYAPEITVGGGVWECRGPDNRQLVLDGHLFFGHIPGASEQPRFCPPQNALTINDPDWSLRARLLDESIQN